MKKITKIISLCALGALGVGAAIELAPVESPLAVAAEDVSVGSKSFKTVDEVTEFNFLEQGGFMSKWGNQPATLEYGRGGFVSQPGQPINGIVKMGSYHTKFRMTTMQSGWGSWWNMMLRQNSGTTEDWQGVKMDMGARQGYEIFTQGGYLQLFENDNGNRNSLGAYKFEEGTDFLKDGSVYDFEIWMLNLEDGSVQICIDVNGVSVINVNTAEQGKLAKAVTEGYINFGGDFVSIAGIGFKASEYGKDIVVVKGVELADELTQFKFTEDCAFMSRWGNQPATLMYNEDGTMTAQPGQPINSVKKMGSYHTKFDITPTGTSAWWNMMLRQNSGKDTNVLGLNMDLEARNGYEVFTQGQYLQLFENVNGTRTFLGAFPFEDSPEFCAGTGKTYTFEIWMLNGVDNDVHIIIDVDGKPVVNINTASSAATLETPVTEGTFRFGGDFVDGQCGVGAIIKGYDVQEKKVLKGVELADDLYELDMSSSEEFISKWGNQPATVVFNEDGSSTTQAAQPINGLKKVGSYHSKFEIYPQNAGGWWNMMLRQNSGTSEAAQQRYIDLGAPNGYEIFTQGGYLQLFENVNAQRVSLGAYKFEEEANFVAGNGTYYTFEIWMLNGTDGEVHIIVDVDGKNVITFDTSDERCTLAEPITRGCVRYGGDFTHNGGAGVGVILKGIGKGEEGSKDAYTITEAPTEVVVGTELHDGDIKITKSHGPISEVISVKAEDVIGWDTESNGEKDLAIIIDGHVVTLTLKVYEYVVADGYQDEYVVGEEYAEDIAVVKVCGESTVATPITEEMLSGFDTSTSGIKEVTLGEFGIKVNIEVASYAVKADAKAEYYVGESLGSITVVKTVGDRTTEIKVKAADIRGFDSSAVGECTLTFSVNGVALSLKVNIIAVPAAETEGCEGSVVAASGLIATLALAGVAFIGKKKEEK